MIEIHKELYLKSSRNEMKKYVPEHSKTILDVGCSDGSFCFSLKDNERELWGIEMNSQTAEEAKKVCNYVFVGDFNEIYDKLPKGYFDCVIFNDVLEHMYSPWDTIDKVRSLLSSNGVMISSVPNYRFIANLIAILIQGEFKYKPEGGILDDTHIRFFTEKSIYRTYNECGYDVLIQEGINSRNDWKVKLVRFLSFGKMNDIAFRQIATVAKPR